MAIELDFMEYADDAAAQAAYVSSDFEPGSWDLLDEDCAAIGDWADDDTGEAESSISPAGQFKFDSGPNSEPNDDQARRTRDIGSYPDIYTIEMKLYHDALGARATDADHFEFRCDNADERLQLYFGTDGLWVYDSDTGYVEVGTNLVKANGAAEWQTWRFLVDMTGAAGVGVMDVYLKDSTHNWEKVGSAVQCSVTGTGGNGKTWLTQLGQVTNNRITHVDYLKVYDGLQVPSLQCYSESAIKEQGSYSLKSIAILTSSLNETLTRSIGSPIDLSGQAKITFDVRASRTGSRFKIGIHDAGGTTTEHTVNIAEVDTWQEENWDISGVSNENKDAIDEIKITILNADVENVFYIDNIYAFGEVKEITGTVAIESTTAGVLTATRAIAGTIVIESIVTGELIKIVVKALAGVVAIESTTSGVLKATRELVGTVVITSTTSGVLKTTRELIGTVVIVSTTSGELVSPLRLLAGTVVISSTVVGELTVLGIKLLAGEVTIKSIVTGILIRWYAKIPPFMHEDLIDPYSSGAWLWLIEIVIPGYSTQRIARNTEAIAYRSRFYLKGNFDVGKQSLSGDASIPRIALRVAQDGTHILEDIVNATKGGENGTIKLIRTCEKYLDYTVGELEADYDILTAESDAEWITFSLGIPNPLIQRLPLWSYSSKVCPYATPSLFKGPRCHYDGDEEVCTGLLKDCRDNKHNAKYWGAEIGLDPNAVRV